MKILAILVLLATVAAAGTVLYGINRLAPSVVQVRTTVTPAEQEMRYFDSLMEQLEDGTFGGERRGETHAPDAQDCAFVTYTVRLANNGFFPAEWISLSAAKQEGDVLVLPDNGAHALARGSVGDLSTTVLCARDTQDAPRSLEVTCYVLGQKMVVQAVGGTERQNVLP